MIAVPDAGPDTSVAEPASIGTAESAAGSVRFAAESPLLRTVIEPEKVSPSGKPCGIENVKTEIWAGVCTVTGDDVFGVAVTMLWSVRSVPLALAVSERDPVAVAVHWKTTVRAA